MAKVIKNKATGVEKDYRNCLLRIILYCALALAGAVFVLFTYGISLVLLLLLLLIPQEVKKRAILKSGIEGETATTAFLKGLPKSYKVIPDVKIAIGTGFAQMDNVVVGRGGVFIIETKNHKGKIYGNDNDEKVLQKKRTESGAKYASRFYNPAKQVKTHAGVMERLLRQSGNRDVPVYPIVFFSNKSARVKMRSNEVPIFSLRKRGRQKLKRYIKSRHEAYLTNEQVSAIADLIKNGVKT